MDFSLGILTVLLINSATCDITKSHKKAFTVAQTMHFQLSADKTGLVDGREFLEHGCDNKNLKLLDCRYYTTHMIMTTKTADFLSSITII